MITVNINNIDDIYYSKRIYEADLKEKGKLEEGEKISLTDFINKLDLSKHIYVTRNNAKVVPFNIITIANEMYLFSTEEDATELVNKLKEINYTTASLKHKTNLDILNEDLIDEPHFLINNEFYI